MKIVVIGRTGAIGGAIARHRAGVHRDDVIGLSRGDGVAADVRDFKSLAQASARVGPVDAVVYCAGTHGQVGPAALVGGRGRAVQAIRVNLIGALHCIAAFAQAPRMIFMGGGGAGDPRPNFAAYAAAKCGLVRLVETVALEEPDRQFNVVAPGVVRSPLTEGNPAAREILAGDRLLQLIDRLLDGPPISGKFIHYRDPWESWTEPPAGLVLRRTV